MQLGGQERCLYFGNMLLKNFVLYILYLCYLYCNNSVIYRNYMLSNLFLASFYESFIVSSAIKNMA